MPWSFKWYDADGDEFLLSDPPTYKVINQSLLHAWSSPFSPVTEYLPFSPGAHLKYINTDVNEVDLTLLTQADANDRTQQNLFNNLLNLSWYFNPLREGQPTKLRVTTPNGIVRDLFCKCISGFTINESTLYEQNVHSPLVFQAYDPYWYSSNISVFAYNPSGQVYSPTFFDIFPFVKSEGRRYNTAVFTIPDENTLLPIVGDVDAYPEWTIYGPARNIKLTNNTTNKTFRFIDDVEQAWLQPAEYMVINMKERTAIKNPQGNNPVNLIPYLTYDSSFWPISPLVNRGFNEIRTEMRETSAQTAVSLSWYPGYLGVT